jgi:hypothetical protein
MAESFPRRASAIKSSFVGIIFFLWNGIPLNFFKIPLWQSRSVVFAIVILCLFLSIRKVLISGEVNQFYTVMTIFFLYICSVTIFYNEVTRPAPIFSWLPGFVYVTPLALFVVYEKFNITPAEIAAGVVGMSVLCALLTIGDQFFNMTAMDQFVRTSYMNQGLRRLVIAKNEQCFSLVFMISNIINGKSFLRKLLGIAGFSALAFSIIAVAESRLALAAVAIGSALYIMFISRGAGKFIFGALFAIAILAVGPIVLQKYISNVGSVSDLQNYDVSVRYRLKEISVFQGFFDKTDGLGFGLMYINERLDNPLSNAMFRMGSMYGAKNYPMGLDDIGFFGALYQFGYVGLAFAILMTAAIVIYLLRAGRDTNIENREIFGVFGCMTLAFLISPLPMNFITLDWTMTIGGTLWYLASCARRDLLQRSA